MKAHTSIVNIGTKQFPGYQLETGEYGLSGEGLAFIINKDESTVRRFAKSKAVKTLIDNGSIVRHNVKAIVNKGKVVHITFYDIPVSVKCIFGQATNGNIDAIAVVEAMLAVSLEERIKAAFGGNARTVEQQVWAESAIMTRELERKRTIDSHLLFCNAVELFGVPAALAHDYLTSLISGWTAKDAREHGYLLPDTNPEIGLNYQDDPYLLRWIADAKVKFGTYRKGTWQERVERAVTDSKPSAQ